MNLNPIYSQDNPKQYSDQTSSTPLVNYFGISVLLPLLLFQYPSSSLLVGILVAIIAAIILIFILIAFILLPLSRRALRRSQKKAAAEVVTVPAKQVPPDPEDETVPSIPAIEIVDDATGFKLPTIATVGQPYLVPVSGRRPANIGWQIAGLTDVGLKRELNEDNLMMIEGEMDGLGPYGLYVVADGLGGHEAGEIASKLAVEAVQKRHQDSPPTAVAAPFEDWLKNTVLMANEAVLKHQDENVETSKMGSTLVMTLVAGGNAHISNVGDSRIYRITSETIEQISVDHSLVERLVQIGQITREEARTHKQRNVIYSIIGEKRKLEVGYYHIAFRAGDRLLLCSDGLSGMVTDEELHFISKHQPDPGKASQMMIEAAKQAGGHDNITAVIIQMNEAH